MEERTTTPILSICIPTFNRYGYLYENLEVLMPQIKNTDVEVLIQDNCSSDGTVDKLKRLKEEMKWDIEIKSNNQNTSPNDNFNKVIMRAKGKYIFLLGDDDILSPNFIDIIIPILKRDKYSLIHFNRLSGNHLCSSNVLHDRMFLDTEEELPFKDFLLRVMSSPNFISSTIFLKKLWLEGENHYLPNRYYGYDFLGREFFPAIGTVCLYYYFPLVIMRNPPRTWTKFNFLYIMVGMYNLFEDLDKEVPGVKEKWIHRARNTHFYDFKMALSQIGIYPDIYRPHKEDILNVCANKSEKFTAKLFLGYPIGGILPKIYIRLLKLWRILRGKYTLSRKVDF